MVEVSRCSCNAVAIAVLRSILAVVRRMRSGSLLMCAPVCSSWVWMSRSTTLRSRILPLGDVSLASVAAGNLQVARLVLLLVLVSHWGCSWVVEQPMTSLMWMHPRFQALFRSTAVQRLTTALHCALVCVRAPASWGDVL